MKKYYNKDGSIDYSFTPSEFNLYIIGCMIKKNNKEIIVRVRGIVNDLSKVVMISPDTTLWGYNMNQIRKILNFAIQHGYVDKE